MRSHSRCPRVPGERAGAGSRSPLRRSAPLILSLLLGCTGAATTPNRDAIEDAGASEPGTDADVADAGAAALDGGGDSEDTGEVADTGPCAAYPIAPVFETIHARELTEPHDEHTRTGGFGVEPTAPSTWRHWSFSNRSVDFDLESATLRTWRFRPTPDARVHIQLGNYGSGVIAVSISECPGRFTGLPASCARPQGQLVWSTLEADDGSVNCRLDPSRDYYLSAAAIDLVALRESGRYRSEGCTGACTVDVGWQVRNNPL